MRRTIAAALASCALVAAASAAQSAPPAGSTPPVVHVYYEKSTDQIRLSVEGAPLGKVFELIRHAASVDLDVTDARLLQIEISIELPLQPVERALRALLKDFNTLFLYSATSDGSALSQVKIVSKRERGAVVARSGDAPPVRAERLVSVERSELDRLLNALKQPLSEREKQPIIDALVKLLLEAPASRDHQAFSDILTQLAAHAPRRAEEAAISLLNQSETNRVFRAMAARALGEVGREKAIDALANAVHGSDPVVQTNAVHSLARIKSDRALKILLQMFKGDNAALQQSVAAALAASGNPQATQALKQMMAVGSAGAGVISRDQAEALNRR